MSAKGCKALRQVAYSLGLGIARIAQPMPAGSRHDAKMTLAMNNGNKFIGLNCFCNVSNATRRAALPLRCFE
ncbi:protein of unknown function [Sterolibacterium denitrificans]|uniref:Uncharacterized protein n=1 Tax=Sterolibacterium denitrificans TaxID=157592 RepID=A0A7Z7HTS2_9PROT|nr:hypothetical protein [Sterolibacterium denitrificans]SMB31319.1 protein of unknown function [Sterolibacterium denitrificans]